MLRKIIDCYRLYYLNDLFEIEWIFYGLSRMLQFYEFVFIWYETSLTSFSL